MLTPMDKFRAVNGVYAASYALRTVGMVYIVAVFEVKKEIPAERLTHGR